MPEFNKIEEAMDGDIIQSWEYLMKYPHLIPLMSLNVKNTLDTLQELIPIKFYRSRLDTFLDWFRKGKEAGLLDAQDDINIKHQMINGAGGM